MSIVDDIKYSYKSGSTLVKLIFINVGLFLVAFLVQLGWSELSLWLAMPSDPEDLVLRLWTPITYMFYHQEIFHILFNMLLLYWMGTIFLEYFNSKQLVVVYFMGGFAGALLFLVSFNLFLTLGDGVLLGASAAVTAIIFAICVYLPEYRINLLLVGPVKPKLA